MGNPFISQALVRDHARALESEAESRRQAADLVTAHLAAVRLFATCSRKELRAVAKSAKIATVKSGAQVITEGDAGNAMYVILTGTARVSRAGRKLALLSKGPRTATVVALSDMEVAIITRRKLTRLLEAAPAFARKLLEGLADVVRENDRKLV